MPKVHLPKWARRFLKPADYKTAYGGRGSGKTWTFAHLIVARCAEKTTRVVVCREFGSSIDQTAKAALETAIERLGLSGEFEVYRNRIVNPHNGSLITFMGLERNRENIRGLEAVDIVWIEEAQSVTDGVALVLIPTIRKEGAEIWLSWNPAYRSDWVWRRFIIDARADDIVQKVNWNDNPWFPPRAARERREDQKNNPELYNHVWEGEPDDETAERKVLPYRLLAECVLAFREGLVPKKITGLMEAGLDVADTGTHFNALVGRRGPLIVHAEKWRAPIIGDTFRRANSYAHANGVVRLFYDVGGIGGGMTSYFRELPTRPYVIRPELFGGAVKGAKTMFSYRFDNETFFQRRNAQLGWALRLRAQNTQRLRAGELVNPEKCLFIDPSIPRLDEFLAQLQQPAWRENELTGKVELMKRDEDEESPDLYDAAVLSFARDSENGLTARPR